MDKQAEELQGSPPTFTQNSPLKNNHSEAERAHPIITKTHQRRAHVLGEGEVKL
jgi:hypothetical protein